jgi:hypothetical protein
MSWNDSFTGSYAYGIQEAYHRVVIKVNFAELTLLRKDGSLQQKHRSLTRNGFLHYIFSFSFEDFENNSNEIVNGIDFFVSSFAREVGSPIEGEIKVSDFAEDSTVQCLYSIMVPLRLTMNQQLLLFLKHLLLERKLPITYVILDLSGWQETAGSEEKRLNEANEEHHSQDCHVYELITTDTHRHPSSVAVKKETARRIDDFNKIKKIIETIDSLQQSLNESLSSERKKSLFWGINPGKEFIEDDHDFLDYFVNLFLQLTKTQSANTDFHHRPPPDPLGGEDSSWIIYNKTDENKDHINKQTFYESERVASSLRLHLFYLILSSFSSDQQQQRGNWKMETMELVHSFGFNTMVEISFDPKRYFFQSLSSENHQNDFDEINEEEEEGQNEMDPMWIDQEDEEEQKNSAPPGEDELTATLRRLAEKYRLSVETFFGKCLLQSGNSLVLDFRFPLKEFLLAHFQRLCHPFSYRKQYVSTHRIISIPIESDDLETFKEISYQKEFTRRNSVRKELYLGPPKVKEWKIQSST